MTANPTVALALACTLLFIACEKKNEQQKDTFTDTRDGKIYKTVKIGEQVWMAENLNYEADGSKCYNDSTAYCDKYGRLYNWETAMSACPNGWHLPSSEKWDILYRYVDSANGTSSPYESKTAGKYLKAMSGWDRNGNGDDKYGFFALPGGSGYSAGNFFDDVGYNGYWWTASEHDSYNAYIRNISYDSDHAYHNGSGKYFLFSVRCLQD
jgi:uncharacterized protein (TIGR02145 family)